MASALPAYEPTIYDTANLQMMQNGLSPLVNLSAQQAAFARDQLVRQQQTELDLQRLTALQNFQREQQARQLQGQHANEIARLKELERQKTDDATIRRTAAEKSFGVVNTRLSQAQEEYEEAVSDMQNELMGRVSKRINDRLAAGTFKTPNDRRTAEIDYSAEELKNAKPAPALEARVRSLGYELQKLTSASNALLDDAVRFGADVGPLLTVPTRPKPSATPRAPLPAPKPEAVNPLANPTRNAVEGYFPARKREIGVALDEASTNLERDYVRPAATWLNNKLVDWFGGNPIDPSKIYSPEEQAAINRRAAAQIVKPQFNYFQQGFYAPAASSNPLAGPVVPTPKASEADSASLLDPNVLRALQILQSTGATTGQAPW